MKYKNKILIVGGTGFIGYHLAKFFLKKNWDVISISRKKASKKRYLKNIKYIFCDTRNSTVLKKKLNKIDQINYVINTSGEINHQLKKKVYQSHFIGVKNLSNYFINKKIKLFLQIGSSMEYGRVRSPQKESFKASPVSHYGKAKLYSTNYLLNLYKKNKFPVLILRPYQLYGPKQDTNRIIPFLIRNCLQNKYFPCSEGSQKRDFLFINDFVECVFKLINKKINGEIFNIGCGSPKKIRDIILLVVKMIKRGKPIFGKVQLRNEESKITFPSIIKLKKEIKWKPKKKLINGLNETINYYKKN